MGEPTNRVRQDHQAVALDMPGFNLSDKPGEVSEYRIQGDRPLGMEAAQLIEIARWLRERVGVQNVGLETRGIRSQTIGVVASPLQPDLFSELLRSVEFR